MATNEPLGLSELKFATRELLTANKRLALCLDFDGTLAPIVEDPNEARLPFETRQHMTALAEQPAVAVAVISGRALEDITSRVDISGISYAGNHGLELQQREDVWVHPDVEKHRPTLKRVLDRIQRVLEVIPGSSVEDKYATATVHYRRVDTDDSGFVIATVRESVENEDRLSMAVDNQTVEIRPDIEQRKGEAVRDLIDVDSETGVVYFGDAQTDVDAFETLAALPTETIEASVGDNLPAASYHLDSPADVEAFLAWLRAEVSRKA